MGWSWTGVASRAAGFDDGRRWVRVLTPMRDVLHHLAARQAFEILNNKLRQLHREGRRPESIELLLHPDYRLW